MTHRARLLAAALIVTAAGCVQISPEKGSPAGLWDATVVVNGLEIPFQFEISGSGSALQGAFLDGDLKVPSTSGSFDHGALVLRFDQYGMKVDVAFTGDRLEGKYDRGTRGVPYPFKALRSVPPVRPIGPVPSIGGEWRVLLDTPTSTGEHSWRMILRQKNADVSGAIMRVDGDTGTLSGSYKEGRFSLGHFAGAGPTLVIIAPMAKDALQVVVDGGPPLLAVRPTDARAKAAPDPVDPTTHLRVVDPSAKFRFSFPDVDGRMIADTDARFDGKVVIVSITGTWCPNCHDEAPFLSRLYKTHRQKGLEIVALAFEEPGQLKDLSRVRGFIKQYDIAYPFLLAGQPEEASQKIPQAVNLNTFPATFVLGKDGRVRATHAGYASKATGEFYEKEQKQFMDEIERLLAE